MNWGLTIDSESDGDGRPSSSVLSDDCPLSRVLWHGWDDDQGLCTVLFNYYLVGVVANHLLTWGNDIQILIIVMPTNVNHEPVNEYLSLFTYRCGTSMCQALVCQRPSGQTLQFDPQSIYMK